MPVLQFKGKTVVETYHHTVPHHALDLDPKLSKLGKGEQPGLDGNLIIEGDNLLALKALLPTHAGRIKCVYIDPPYNTGNEGWVYNDNLTQPQFKEWIGQTVGKEGEDATRHDKWCCMMYPRLQLLKQLLREDGAIFVSIGEDEIGDLRFLMDEIFLTDKPLATFVWKRRSPSGMRDEPVSVDHEYVLMYAKNAAEVTLEGLVADESKYPLKDRGGRYASTDLTIGMTSEDRPNQFYEIKNPRTGKEYPANPDRVWRFEPDTMRRIIKDDLVIWPDEVEGKMTRPRFKTYFDPNHPKMKPVSTWIETSSRKRVEIAEEAEEYDLEILTSGMNQEGGRILQRIFGKKVFEYPKPPSLVKALVRVATGKNGLVLDSFAGSGTTGHATMELNSEDAGTRRFILIQLPFDTKEQQESEFNVCREVTAERVRKVAEGYTYDKGTGKAQRRQHVEGLGGKFSYARLGERLFGEYREMKSKPPAFAELAKYIFYTETSQDFEPNGVNQASGKIGERKGTAYYLLYTPNGSQSRALDLEWLGSVGRHEKNRQLVVYCEKLWLHREDLAKFETETGRRVRPMLIPFNLK
jgi:adenine-specific DNA-methyltransferase